MLDCRIHTFKFPGQFGTHIDFPGHFVKDGDLSEAYDVKQGVFPLCVVDITDKVAQDVHYAVTAQDIKDYEAKYGPIPDGAFVALRTDWYKNWPDMWIPMPQQKLLRPKISHASAMFLPRESFRSRFCATWTKWLPQALSSLLHGPGSKALPAFPQESGRSLSKECRG